MIAEKAILATLAVLAWVGLLGKEREPSFVRRDSTLSGGQGAVPTHILFPSFPLAKMKRTSIPMACINPPPSCGTLSQEDTIQGK